MNKKRHIHCHCVFKLCDLKIRISRSIILGVVLVYKRNPKHSKELIHVCCILFHHQYTVWNEKACSYTRLQLNPPYVYCLTSTQLIFHFAMQPAFLVPNKKMCIILQRRQFPVQSKDMKHMLAWTWQAMLLIRTNLPIS